jgi:putative acetyltransferase
VEIREETASDHDAIRALHMAAFGHGQQVAALVDDLREESREGTGLSLVAVDGASVVGHIFFSRGLLDAPRRLVEVQVLSPLGVEPDHQRRGIGGALIARGIELLSARGVPLVFLEGDPRYYSRHGFVLAGEKGFRKPSLRIPDAGFQVRLLPSYEGWMTGTLVYPQAFWDNDLVGLREADPRMHEE